jgi:hypothetical protein
MPDSVNARNIFACKCAEYSSTNEAIGSNTFRYLPPAAGARETMMTADGDDRGKGLGDDLAGREVANFPTA